MIFWVLPAGLPRSYPNEFTLVALETLQNNLEKRKRQGDGIFCRWIRIRFIAPYMP
jgi:hypothetical protein